MGKSSRHISLTPATQWLHAQGVAYTEHVYEYVDMAVPPGARRAWGCHCTR